MPSFAETQPAKAAPFAGGSEADVCRNRRSDFGQWISGRGVGT
jgi:hypothetical protein